MCYWEIKFYMNTHGEWPYFEGQSAVQVARDGWYNVTLGYGVVTGVGEALAAAVLALALIDLSSTGPHSYSAATLWGFKQEGERFENEMNICSFIIVSTTFKVLICMKILTCMFTKNKSMLIKVNV